MTEENRRDAIEKELRHAAAAYKAALLLRQGGLHNDALSRLYYAMFHTLTALLLTAGIEPRKHRGLPHLLGTHFSSFLTAADIALVSRAATYRDLADYERTWDATDEIVGTAFADLDPLLARVRKHLADTGWSGGGA